MTANLASPTSLAEALYTALRAECPKIPMSPLYDLDSPRPMPEWKDLGPDDRAFWERIAARVESPVSEELRKCLELGVLVQEAKDELLEENLALRRQINALEQ
jgi:hypothetical protein